MKVKRRPKVGDSIRFNLRYGSAPGTVMTREGTDTSVVRDDRENAKGQHTTVSDADVCYINGRLTGNESDDEG